MTINVTKYNKELLNTLFSNSLLAVGNFMIIRVVGIGVKI